MADKLVTTVEAAKGLGVSNRTLAHWVQDERLAPTSNTLGDHLRWDLDDFREKVRQLQEDA